MAITIMAQKAAPPTSDQGQFFKFFQGEVNALQDRMQLLESYSISERNDAIEFCLSGISQLTSEVKDASSYLPAYDQRTYSDAIKALTEKLQKIRQSLAPRQKFSFRSGFPKKNASAISIADAAELAAKQRLSAPGGNFSSTESSINPTPLESPAPEPMPPTTETGESTTTGYDGNDLHEEGQAAGTTIRKPSFSNATRVAISNHKDKHIILPSSASHATASATLSNLSNCVVDLTLATSTGKPFAALYLKNVTKSLIICGRIDGAAHITGVKESVLVMGVRQFRMHESADCDLYLHCGSHPIIEDCSGLSFAPLPKTYEDGAQTAIPNQYDQVDDFKWLKAEASPNWKVLGVGERVDEQVWREVVPGKPGVGHTSVLKAVGVGGV